MKQNTRGTVLIKESHSYFTSDIAMPTNSYIHDEAIAVKLVPYAVSKRVLDILVSIIVIILLSWLFILVAIIVKITSPGEIIFKQTRIGKGGRKFTCYKFRSMYKDAEKRKQEIAHLNEASGPVFKIKSDPRITRFGSFIRKTSIDELPQLFNVLKGEMSLVGPRPPLPDEVACYNLYQTGRLAIKPGITCLWQISGRSNVSFDSWVELDLAYIETMSFQKDIEILLKTIPAVLSGRGAQ